MGGEQLCRDWETGCILLLSSYPINCHYLGEKNSAKLAKFMELPIAIVTARWHTQTAPWALSLPGEGITLIFWSSCRCEIEHEMGEMRPRQLHWETRRGRSEYYVKAEFRKLPSAAALVEKLNIKGRDILRCISWQKLSEAGAALDIAFGSRSQ